MRTNRLQFLLRAVILASVLAGPAFGGEVVTHSQRLTIGEGVVCGQWVIPTVVGGEAGVVIGVNFIGRYRNVGSGFNAASAEFSLFGAGVWAIRGSHLGWSGQGNFGPTYRSSDVFNGPLDPGASTPLGPGTTLWEVCSYSPTNGSEANFVDSEFLVTVRYGQVSPEGPNYPNE